MRLPSDEKDRRKKEDDRVQEGFDRLHGKHKESLDRAKEAHKKALEAHQEIGRHLSNLEEALGGSSGQEESPEDAASGTIQAMQ